MVLQPKVRRGESLNIEAPTFNAFLDAAAFVQQQRHGPRVTDRDDFRDAGVVLVRNAHAAAFEQFDSVGVESSAITPALNPAGFKERVILTCSLPIASSEGKFAVLQEPLAVGAIGSAVVSGVTPARLSLTNATDEFCDVVAGSPYLFNSPAGSAQILYHQGVSGVQLGIVRVWGKQYGRAFVAKAPAGGIAAMSGTTPGSATVTLYRLSGSSIVTTGITITAKNMAGAVAANAYIQVKQDAYGTWWVDVEKC